MFKQIRGMIARHKVKNNFSKCILCPEGENIFASRTGEVSYLMSSEPLVQSIIKTKGVCKDHRENLANGASNLNI
jgi:hypothetical protein